MAHADPRPRFNSYPTPISTNYPPSSSKPYYTYAAATPTSTPTKSHPSSSYHYRQASNASQTRLAAAPVQSSSSRPVPRSSSSIPNPRTASSSVPPPTNRSNTLPSSSESYSHSRKNSMSRPQVPTTDAYRSAKREDDRYASARAQQHQQYADAQQRQADAQRQARLIAERDATLKRMEERQRKAQATSWFEESQRLAAVAAEEQRKREDERRRADEKLRRAAQAQVDEERRMHARKQERGHERGRSQTHNPAAAAADKKWYQNIFRDKSRDGRRRDDRGSGSDREPRERAKSEGRAREAVEARERVDKDRARSANSSSTVSAAWATYEKVTSELMDAKPSKGKTSSNLTFYDIPWPILGQANSFHDLTNQNIAAFLLSPHHSQGKSPKSRLRAAILIWHPDKFAQKVLPHVAESHRPAVVAAVNVVARIVTELISSAGN